MEPIKIDRQRKRKTSRSVSSRVSARRATPVQTPTRAFSARLLSAQSTSIRKELDNLLVQIDKQANEIEQSLTFETLRVYKELVRKFVYIVVNELYEVEESISVSTTGRKKSMLLVKKIDDQLEQLSDDFLKKQASLLDFMGRLDDIRGLLMDLYT